MDRKEVNNNSNTNNAFTKELTDYDKYMQNKIDRIKLSGKNVQEILPKDNTNAQWIKYIGRRKKMN